MTEIFCVKVRGKCFSFDPICLSNNRKCIELLHNKSAHFHYVVVFNMQQKELVHGLPHLDSKLPSYMTYQYGKQSILPFKQTTWRATKKLQLIHIDLVGCQRSASLKESKYYSKYYITFIHDFTRMCWICFLKSKLEVACVFWRFKQ